MTISMLLKVMFFTIQYVLLEQIICDVKCRLGCLTWRDQLTLTSKRYKQKQQAIIIAISLLFFSGIVHYVIRQDALIPTHSSHHTATLFLLIGRNIFMQTHMIKFNSFGLLG